MKNAIVAAILAALVALPALAHHGKDFLIVESFELPHPQTVFLVTSEQLLRADGEWAFHDEPSLLFGVTDDVAGEVHAHFTRLPGEHLAYAAIAPAVHIRIADEGAWHLGASAEYEIARHRDDDNAVVRLIGGRSLGEGAVVLNLGFSRQRHGSARAVYAVGFRPDLETKIGWGAEMQRTEDEGARHEILGALYAQPNERLTVKAGAGAEVGHGAPGLVVRTGIVWRF